jgi:multidrug efflux pump subunit AcrA (membrane-fusion protein)
MPYVWGVSDAGRIFAKKITIGRTLGSSIEVYEGLKNGDRYIVDPTQNIHEDTLLENLAPKDSSSDAPAKSGEKAPMGGMEM